VQQRIRKRVPAHSPINCAVLNYCVCSLFKTYLNGLLLERPGIIISITTVRKTLHWLKIPERIHFKVLSPTYSSL